VQLRDDDSFGAVNDEGAIIGHQRQLAHVDFVFLDILDLMGAGFGILVHQHQPQSYPQRCGVGQPQRCGVGQTAQLAFANVEHWLSQPVTNIFQPCAARIADDGKHGLESGVQPNLPAISRRYFSL